MNMSKSKKCLLHSGLHVREHAYERILLALCMYMLMWGAQRARLQKTKDNMLSTWKDSDRQKSNDSPQTTCWALEKPQTDKNQTTHRKQRVEHLEKPQAQHHVHFERWEHHVTLIPDHAHVFHGVVKVCHKCETRSNQLRTWLCLWSNQFYTWVSLWKPLYVGEFIEASVRGWVYRSLCTWVSL